MSSSGAPLRSGHRFVLISLPRSGSTGLASVLNVHPEIRCLIEPFHPKRFDGRFHNYACGFSVEAALEGIWRRWNGIKHVFEAGGWPFLEQPELNQSIVAQASVRVVLLIRRNFLRRCVSNMMCRKTGYWIGSRQEFLRRLAGTQLPPIDPKNVALQVMHDHSAVMELQAAVETRKSDVLQIYYEDLFGDNLGSQVRLARINDLLRFLGFGEITIDAYTHRWAPFFDPEQHRWADEKVYRQIPGIDRVEREVGSDAMGWLLR